MPQEPALTDSEQKSDDVWNEHLRAEFSTHSPDETIVTMSANPLNNQVPVMIGGDGREQVYEFYTKYFLPQIPADVSSRTIASSRRTLPNRVNNVAFRS
jgi:carboxymethylenebutenolidase